MGLKLRYARPARAAVAAAVLALALAGCSPTSYRYQARGTLALPAGDAGAVLYWRGDEGRLWYGKAYARPDSGAVLRVCGEPPLVFVAGEGDTLRLDSGSGDTVVGEIRDAAGVATVDPPRRVRAGALCGVVRAGGVPVATGALTEGVQPELVFLCANARRPQRYPAPGAYLFAAVSKSVAREGGDPEPCPAR